jgi:hypothetical protein
VVVRKFVPSPTRFKSYFMTCLVLVSPIVDELYMIHSRVVVLTMCPEEFRVHPVYHHWNKNSAPDVFLKITLKNNVCCIALYQGLDI